VIIGRRANRPHPAGRPLQRGQAPGDRGQEGVGSRTEHRRRTITMKELLPALREARREDGPRLTSSKDGGGVHLRLTVGVGPDTYNKPNDGTGGPAGLIYMTRTQSSRRSYRTSRSGRRGPAGESERFSGRSRSTLSPAAAQRHPASRCSNASTTKREGRRFIAPRTGAKERSPWPPTLDGGSCTDHNLGRQPGGAGHGELAKRGTQPDGNEDEQSTRRPGKRRWRGEEKPSRSSRTSGARSRRPFTCSAPSARVHAGIRQPAARHAPDVQGDPGETQVFYLSAGPTAPDCGVQGAE